MLNEQLLEYINEQFAAGLSKDDISKNLISTGWTVSDINEAFAAATTPVKPSISVDAIPNQTDAESLISVSNLFSASWNLCKTHLATLLAISFVPYILIGASLFFQTMGNHLVDNLFSFLGTLSIYVFCTALVHAIAKRGSFMESYRIGFSLFFPFLWIGILTFFIFLGGAVMLVIPGILMIVWFSLILYTVTLEGKRGLNAFIQSREYVRGYWLALFGRYLLLFIIEGIIFTFVIFPTNLLFGKTIAIVSYLVSGWLTTPFLFAYSYNIYQSLTKLKPSLAASSPTRGRSFFIACAAIGFLFIVAVIVLVSVLVINLKKAQLSSITAYNQTIIARESIIQSGGVNVFSVAKKPVDAALWTVRFEVPEGVRVGLQAIDLDGKTAVGPPIDFNKDIVLGTGSYAEYPNGIMLVMEAYNDTNSDQVVNITSKTFDSSGAVLSQSTLPITIKFNVDNPVYSLLNKVRPQSSEYEYVHAQGGFTDFCTSPDSASVGGILDILTQLRKLSGTVVCKDSQKAWAISVQTKSDPSKYFCVDGSETVVTRGAAITTTSCK